MFGCPRLNRFRYAPQMPESSQLLFVDTASPVVSVALGADGHSVAERTIEPRRTSERLLPVIEDILREVGLERQELAGIAALQGPGSFTGLRIGLATVLGLHQALGVPATAIPTLPLLALACDPGDRQVIAAVDAIRGDWYTQSFRIEQIEDGSGNIAAFAESEAGLMSGAELLARSPARIVGFGIGNLAATPSYRQDLTELLEPPPLAPLAACHLTSSAIEWDPFTLTSPIYFRPPAVTLPKA